MIEACDSTNRTIIPSQTDISPSCYCELMQRECNSIAPVSLSRLSWWRQSVVGDLGGGSLRGSPKRFNQRASRRGSRSPGSRFVSVSESGCFIVHASDYLHPLGGRITRRSRARGVRQPSQKSHDPRDSPPRRTFLEAHSRCAFVNSREEDCHRKGRCRLGGARREEAVGLLPLSKRSKDMLIKGVREQEPTGIRELVLTSLTV